MIWLVKSVSIKRIASYFTIIISLMFMLVSLDAVGLRKRFDQMMRKHQVW